MGILLIEPTPISLEMGGINSPKLELHELGFSTLDAKKGAMEVVQINCSSLLGCGANHPTGESASLKDTLYVTGFNKKQKST